MKSHLIKVGLAGLMMLGACSGSHTNWRSRAEDPEFLHRSIKQITDVIVHDIFSPPVAARIYAYSAVAAYETARHQDANLVSLAGQLNGLKPLLQPDPDLEYCFQLASVEAVLKVGRTLVFSEDRMDKFYEQIMREYKEIGIPEEIFDRSLAFGDTLAAQVLAWSSKDNYKQTRSFPKYTIVQDPATWKPTPPAYMDAIEPHWNKIRTFVIDSAAQFKPVPPTPFSKEKVSKFYKEALEVHDIVVNLSKEQREIAFFWDCNPFMMNVKGHVMFATKKISPGGHWMNITRVACRTAKTDFGQASEAYVRVALSLVDGFISCWDEKYRSRLIRPETYINQYISEDWVPLLQTPPFPEYTSGHSVISGAAAIALTGLFGQNFAFTDSTEVEFGLTARSFKSFEDACAEAAISRVYGGIHYKPACEIGLIEGKAIGNFIANKIRTRKGAVTASR